MESWTCETLSIQLLSYRQPALFTDYYIMATPHEEQTVAVQCSNWPYSKEMRVYRHDFWSINLL